MEIKLEKQLIQKNIFIAEDGKEFSSEKECLKHESFCRGKGIIKSYNFHDETRYGFFVSNEKIWKDCLIYLGEKLYSNFLDYHNYEDFKNQWVFTEYDTQGDFYKLRTRDEIGSMYHRDIDEIKNDLVILYNFEDYTD